MRKFCWLFVLLALPLAGQNDAWKKFESPTGNFSVLLPGQPQDTILDEGEGVQAHMLKVQDKAIVYSVIYVSIAQEQVVNDANYQEFKRGILSKMPKCEVSAEEQPSPALNGYIGHWYKLDCSGAAKVTIEGNFYLGKHYCYGVIAAFPASPEEPQAAKKFIDSFTILTSSH
jgi:hypothetical protein